jgi:hypothetical protein
LHQKVCIETGTAHVIYNVVTWSPATTKKQEAENRKLFKHDGELTIFLMNIEAFSTKKGLDIAQRFLLAHQTLMAIDESTTIKSPTASRTKNIRFIYTVLFPRSIVFRFLVLLYF